MIGQDARPRQAVAVGVENLALVVGLGRDLVARRDRLGLSFGEAGAAGLARAWNATRFRLWQAEQTSL